MTATRGAAAGRVESEIAVRLETAVVAVRLAAADTLRWFGDPGLAVEEKADASPVTAADRAAEAILRRELLGRFPHDAFLGEETGTTAGTSGYEWVVDPIDGTKSFIRGVPLYATLVGCRREAAGVVGVIAIPALDEIVWAASGGGAWHARGSGTPQAARVSARTPLADALVCSSDFVSFGRHSGGGLARHSGGGLARHSGGGLARHSGGDAARTRLERACRIARTWGDGYGYLLVATGRAEVMIDPLLNPWDAAAVETVVTEAGGRFSDWQGRPRIDSGDGVATNGLLHDEVLALLQAP